MFYVAQVAKIGYVVSNDDQSKYILYQNINQYEDIQPAISMANYYNAVYNMPVTPQATIQHPVKLSEASTRKDYWVGYVVWNSNSTLYQVKGLLNAGNVGTNPKPVYDPTVYYNNVPFQVARMAVDYYNENNPYQDTPESTIFKYIYIPNNM